MSRAISIEFVNWSIQSPKSLSRRGTKLAEIWDLPQCSALTPDKATRAKLFVAIKGITLAAGILVFPYKQKKHTSRGES